MMIVQHLQDIMQRWPMIIAQLMIRRGKGFVSLLLISAACHPCCNDHISVGSDRQHRNDQHKLWGISPPILNGHLATCSPFSKPANDKVNKGRGKKNWEKAAPAWPKLFVKIFGLLSHWILFLDTQNRFYFIVKRLKNAFLMYIYKVRIGNFDKSMIF